jgi:hypothetical protein
MNVRQHPGLAGMMLNPAVGDPGAGAQLPPMSGMAQVTPFGNMPPLDARLRRAPWGP